ncbi:tetratricopeptide repeat protein [Aurantibacter sp.]|uniref:tetratricopeptide repeat protein n=1 Tax=Aurantibacter sp. TaxID=2807103 RepID=UPI0035C803B5
MKLKATFLFVLLLNITFGYAQEDCATKLSLMVESAKAKAYDAAYPQLQSLRKDCAKYHYGIYAYGEKVLKHKVDNSSGEEKKAFIADYAKLYSEAQMYFSSKFPKGEYMGKAAQLNYDNKELLGIQNEDLYNQFDAAYKADAATFDSAKSLYVYFKLMVGLFDEGKKPASDLFNKYDDVVERIDAITESYQVKLNKYVAKEESGAALTSKDKKYKANYEANIAAFEKVSGSVDAELGSRANCENLIPLYTKDFEANKENAVWLKRSVSRMFYKECTEDPLYEKLVKAYDAVESSADTKYFVGTILFNKGKVNEAMNYFKESFDLQTDPLKKAKLANKIASSLKKKGRYGEARQYFEKALKLNPSNKYPHVLIASMYASSANNCGDTNFNKRAVFWLAANEADRAGGKGSSYAKSYRAKAPTKSEIFSAGNAGQTIKIGCWIGRSVTVPSL